MVNIKLLFPHTHIMDPFMYQTIMVLHGIYFVLHLNHMDIIQFLCHHPFLLLDMELVQDPQHYIMYMDMQVPLGLMG